MREKRLDLQFEGSKEQREKLENLEKAWNETLIQVLKSKHQEIGKELPKLEERELIEKAPYLLEEATEGRLKEKKGKNRFLVISGPSGVGKGAIESELEKKTNILFLPNVTTRSPRAGEKEGIDYFFVGEKEFERMKKEGRFFQYGKTHGAWHGFLRDKFLEGVSSKEKFYLEKSIQSLRGLEQKEEFRKVAHLSLFILPPSFEELCFRIRTSWKGAPFEEIEKRLARAPEELRESTAIYDAYLVNDEIPRVTKKIIKNF